MASGYYKNGRLHIVDRHSPGDLPTDHDQGPLQDKRRQRSNTPAHLNEDRQEQQASTTSGACQLHDETPLLRRPPVFRGKPCQQWGNPLVRHVAHVPRETQVSTPEVAGQVRTETIVTCLVTVPNL
ncbi:hypothetical protein BaRGS_00023966 [Batillaria attramentaria]|uniref:Uncharacterized protein n=1 Tax=Batillaria attramentaria TaxID=370345 RepID=A0ABD0KCY8_9CAEN